MDSKTEPASEAKERIDKEASTYVSHNWDNINPDTEKAYIAGATAEYNRAQEEITRLKAELEKKKNAFRDGWIAKHKSLTEELERERELRKEFTEWSKALISDVHFQERYPGVLNGLKNLLFKSIRERSIFKAKN